MRDPYLIVDVDHRGDYRLVWYLPEDEDIGGTLGEVKYKDADLDKASPEDRECVLAYLTAKVTDGAQHDGSGLFWNSQRSAARALRAVKAVIKRDGGAPWPDWAIKAQAEGWKPPRGWKPS